jgi:prepilin-type N-terminal cleavage/methylation domain-containing protein
MPTRSDRGVSLVELMVALIILAVALLGLGLAYPQTRFAVEIGNQVTTAANLARQTLETMRNQTYTETTDDITAADFPDENYGDIAGFPQFRRTVTVENGVPEAVCVPPPGTPCTKRVTVNVFYRDNVGQEQVVRVATVFVR